MNSKMVCFVGSCCLVVVLGLAFPVLSQAAGPPDLLAPAKVRPAVMEALEASPDGTVFALTLLEGLPAGTGLRIEERKVRVQEAQQSVLNEVGDHLQVAYRYQFIPALAGRVNRAALEILEAHPQVKSVFLDQGIEGHLAESVPFINADQVQNQLGFTGEGITVAVLDTGINANHLDLSDNIAPGAYHFLDQGVTTGAGAPEVNGHGSNVAGIITSGGVVNPVGVAPDCDILAVKVLKDVDGLCGGQSTGWVSDWAAGVDYVLEHKNDYENLCAINMSLGTLDTYTACPCDDVGTYTQMMAAAADAAKGCGITLFASSGNNGLCAVSSPACLSSVVSVGAVYDQDYGREPDSGTYAAFGTGWPDCYDDPAVPDMMCCFSNHHFCQDLLDLLAPGRNITSAWCGGNNSWSTYTGTSQACPHCTGVAALMAEVRDFAPPLSPDEVASTMRDTGVSVIIDGECGFPLFKKRVDALAAVTAATPLASGCFEFICNGDFEDPPGFNDAGTSDPHDQGQDSLPGCCWRRYETFTGGVDEASAILADTFDNGPSQPGDQCPRFWRFFDSGSGDWTMIIQDVRIDAEAFTALTLNLDVKVSNHNLVAGGNVTPAFEWPALVQIRYIAQDESTQIWRHGWYLDPPGDGIRTVDPGQGLIAEYEDDLVQTNVWNQAGFDLFEELPQVKEIREIRVGGSGWDYQSRFDNVSITGCRCVCGDIDGGGGLVDLNDFATFALCYGLSGPGGDCDEQGFFCSDLDGNDMVDLVDFATFALWFGLESSQMVPDCAP